MSEETLPWSSRETILRTVVDAHENIVSISLVDTTGREKVKIFNPLLLEKEPGLLNFKSDETFKLMLEKKQNQIMSNLYFYESKDPRLNLFHRLNERFSLLIVLSLKTLWAQLNEIHIGKTGYAFLVNQKGKIIAHPDKEKFWTEAATNLDIVNQAIKAVSEGSSEYPDEKGE
ncbi:unnamed protein product [marine sediment metagenome]|uniref:Cache 3/Cache 2 fusion domain-containing protein n=1 Tax=marine sediment metagenome TaxID=412755 RepID=X1QJ70_9ZZZZ